MNKLQMKGRKWEVFVVSVGLFSEKGYANVSMKDIASEIDVSAPSLYNYFPSKEDILYTMYDFYKTNIYAYSPPIDSIIAETDSKEPEEILSMMNYYFEPELQSLMDRILIIVHGQSNIDQKAQSVLKEYFFVFNSERLRMVLNKMITVKKIKPFDIESYISIYTNYAFAAALQSYSDNPITFEEWTKGCEFLFSFVKGIK